MSKINKYIIIFNREFSIDEDIILYIKQDLNRPNNPTDDELIEEYIENNYGHTDYEAEELDMLEEEII